MIQPERIESGPADIDDVDEVTAWLREMVGSEIRRLGQPRPRIVFVEGGGLCELDLSDLCTLQPGAHVGATWRMMQRQRTCWLVARLTGSDPDGRPTAFAMIVRDTGGDDAFCVQLDLLPYETDSQSIGRPKAWELLELDDPEGLPVALLDWLVPPANARPGRIGAPRDAGHHLTMAPFEVGAVPEDALAQAEAAARWIVPDMIATPIRGLHVLCQRGHQAEHWVLEGALPAPTDDMLRAIAGREPDVDGLAILKFTVFDDEHPARRGIEIVAERDGRRAVRRVLLDMPDGPKGRAKVVSEKHGWLPNPRDAWIGVDPLVDFALLPQAVADA